MTYLIEREPARFVAEDAALTDEQITGILNARSDFDSDGLVTILDVMLILQKLTE